MTFTDNKPDRPGAYQYIPPCGEPVDVGIVTVYEYSQDGSLQFNGVNGSALVSEMKGTFIRLVPAEEVEKAWIEGVAAVVTANTIGTTERGAEQLKHVKGDELVQMLWSNSRAKRVAEGME